MTLEVPQRLLFAPQGAEAGLFIQPRQQKADKRSRTQAHPGHELMTVQKAASPAPSLGSRHPPPVKREHLLDEATMLAKGPAFPSGNRPDIGQGEEEAIGGERAEIPPEAVSRAGGDARCVPEVKRTEVFPDDRHGHRRRPRSEAQASADLLDDFRTPLGMTEKAYPAVFYRPDVRFPHVMHQRREPQQGCACDAPFDLGLQAGDDGRRLLGQQARQQPEDPVERPDRLQGVREDIEPMRGTLETPAQWPHLGDEGLEKRKRIHGGEPPAGVRCAQDVEELLPQPLGSRAPQEERPAADRLGAPLLDAEAELCRKADTAEQTQGVFRQDLRSGDPDPLGLQIPQAARRIHEAGRIILERDCQGVDREVSVPEILEDTPAPQRPDIHLPPLLPVGKDHAPEAFGEVDDRAGEPLRERRTEQGRVGAHEIDVERPGMPEEGVPQKAADEIDRNAAAPGSRQSDLLHDGVMSDGAQAALDAAGHQFTVSEGRGNVNGTFPPRSRKFS